MLDFYAGTYDLAVIGAGHAGIEAALAGARLGAKTLCICTSLDGVGNLPCNPSVGGTGIWAPSSTIWSPAAPTSPTG